MRRRFHLTVEACESRELLSGLMAVLRLPPHSHTNQHIHVETGGVGGGGGGGGGTAIGNITDSLSPPATAHEVARRAFFAKFAGPVLEGAPRTVDQARQFRITAPGFTNSFRHATLDMVYFTPSDPKGPVTGAASILDRNINDSGVILFFLQGNPQDVDRLGRPTHFAFDVNGGGGSGGVFASSVGHGTIDIHYRGRSAIVAFNGSINTTGIGSTLKSFT